MSRGEVVELSFTVASDDWLSANQRIHWAAKAKRTAMLRDHGWQIGFDSQLAYLEAVHVTAHIGYPTNERADPANAAPTVKALIDGLVDAGVFIDDDHTHLIGPDYRRDTVKAPRGFHTVRLEIVEILPENSRDSAELEPVPGSKNASEEA